MPVKGEGMIKKIDIINTGVVDSIRNNMSLATRIDSGLLSNTMFSMFMDGSVPGKQTYSNTDINKLYLDDGEGMTLYILTAGSVNSPGAGLLMHFQRLPKGNISISSFSVCQLALLKDGTIKYRYGNSDGINVTYSSWRTI